MTLLRFTLQPGQSIFDQVVFAAVKAFVSGEFLALQRTPVPRAARAGSLFALTAATGVGIFGAFMNLWLPNL